MLLLDTHTLIWLDEGNAKLGSKALALIDQNLKQGELFVSAVSFWEVAMLVAKKRLQITMEIDLWRKSLIDNGLNELALDGDTAIYSALLQDFHGDLADRMIVASAIKQSAILCTADKKILSWKHKLVRLNAYK